VEERPTPGSTRQTLGAHQQYSVVRGCVHACAYVHSRVGACGCGTDPLHRLLQPSVAAQQADSRSPPRPLPLSASSCMGSCDCRTLAPAHRNRMWSESPQDHCRLWPPQPFEGRACCSHGELAPSALCVVGRAERTCRTYERAMQALMHTGP
jgi:hypothetical protein